MTPIVILSARGEEKAKIEALELGADDYVTKPFGIGELVARMRTALRHRLQEQGAEPVFDHDGLHVERHGRKVEVTKSEAGYRIKVQRVDMTNAQAAFEYVLQVWV